MSLNEPTSPSFKTVFSFLSRHRIRFSWMIFTALIVVNIYHGTKPHTAIRFSDLWDVLSTLLITGGVFLRSWAAGVLRKRAVLTTTGPYALVRHPLYTGSFIIMLGFWVLFGDGISLIVVISVIALIYATTIHREEEALAARYGDQWRRYVLLTPAFFPGRLPRRSDLRWSIGRWLRNKEYKALLTVIAALFALATLNTHAF